MVRKDKHKYMNINTGKLWVVGGGSGGANTRPAASYPRTHSRGQYFTPTYPPINWVELTYPTTILPTHWVLTN